MDIFSIYKTMPETHKENLKSYYIFKGIYDCFPDIDEEDAKFIYKITSKVENENINPYSISHYLTDHYTRGNLTKNDLEKAEQKVSEQINKLDPETKDRFRRMMGGLDEKGKEQDDNER